ncbi:CPBP family intramembrane metalloprotease [bacterium]|nr:CPBP family intramembrane metalloprotease [bacterium]
MDSLENGKDTELFEERRLTRLQAVVHFLMGSGLFIVFFLIFYMIALVTGAQMTGLSFEEIASNFKALYDNPLVLKIVNFLASSVPLLIVAIIIGFISKVGVGRYLAIDKLPKLRPFLLCVLFFIAVQPLGSWLLEINQNLDLSFLPDSIATWIINSESLNNETYQAMFGSGEFGGLATTLIFMALMPAIAEEFFFRGFLLRVMNGTFQNFHMANLVTSLIFTAIHFQFFKLFPMMILSLTLGYLVYFTGSLWMSILVHLANNAITILYVLSQDGGNYQEMMTEGSQMPWFIVLISSFALVGLFVSLNNSDLHKLKNIYE